MKKLYILIFVALVTLSLSCKKNSEISIESVDLLGTWELRDVRGGYRIANSPLKEYLPGNGNLFRFTDTGYEKMSDGQSAVKGTYELRVEKFYGYDKLMTRIIFDGDEKDTAEYLEMVDGKLKIHRGMIASDGIESMYVKITEAN